MLRKGPKTFTQSYQGYPYQHLTAITLRMNNVAEPTTRSNTICYRAATNIASKHKLVILLNFGVSFLKIYTE